MYDEHKLALNKSCSCLISMKYVQVMTKEIEEFLFFSNKPNFMRLSHLNVISEKDDFNIINKIGKGGFSSVYLCKRKKDNKLFALKEFELPNMDYATDKVEKYESK